MQRDNLHGEKIEQSMIELHNPDFNRVQFEAVKNEDGNMKALWPVQQRQLFHRKKLSNMMISMPPMVEQER